MTTPKQPIDKKITYCTVIEVNDKSGDFIPYWDLAMKEHLDNNFLRIGSETNKSGVKSLRALNIKLINKEDKFSLESLDPIRVNTIFTIDVHRINKEKEINSNFIKYFKETYNKNNFTVVLYTIDEVKDSTMKSFNKICDKIKSKTGIQDVVIIPYNKTDFGKLYAIIDTYFTIFKGKISIELTNQMAKLAKKLDEQLKDKDLYEDPVKCWDYVKDKIVYLDLLTMGDYWEEMKKVCEIDLYKIFKGLSSKYVFKEELNFSDFDVNNVKKRTKNKVLTNLEYQQYLIFNCIKSYTNLKEYKKIAIILHTSANKMYLYEYSHKNVYNFIFWIIHYITSSINYLNALLPTIPDEPTKNIINFGIMSLLCIYLKNLKVHAEKVKIEIPSIKMLYNLKQYIDESKNLKEELNNILVKNYVDDEKDEYFIAFKETAKNFKSDFSQKISEMLTCKKSFLEEYLNLLKIINSKNAIHNVSFRFIFEIIPLSLLLCQFDEVKNLLKNLLEHQYIKNNKWKYIKEYISFIAILALNVLERNSDNLELMFKLLTIKFTKKDYLLKIINCDNENLINEIISDYVENFNNAENEKKFFILDEVINVNLNEEKDDIIFINKIKNKTQQLKYKFTNNTGLNFNIEKIELIFEEVKSDSSNNKNNPNEKITYLIESDKNNFKKLNPENQETESFFDIETDNNIFKNNTIYKFTEIHYILKNNIYGLYHVTDEMKLCFNSMDMQISTKISPSFDTPDYISENYFFNVLALIEINISDFPEISEFDDKTLKFQFEDINPKEGSFLFIQHEVLNETIKKNYPEVIFTKLGIEFPPGSLKDKETLSNLKIPFCIENVNFYSNGSNNIKISAIIEKNNEVLYTYFSYHIINLNHLFNIRKKFRLVKNNNFLMQSTFSLNIETNNVKIYSNKVDDNAFYLDTTQAVNLILLLNNSDEEIIKKLRNNFLEFSLDENKKFRLCYPENNILEEIKELIQTPYHITIEVDDCQHDIFKEITVRINIKKHNDKNVVLLTHICDNENWAIIGKSKFILEWDANDKNEKLIKVQLLPLVDGFLRLPEIEFSECEIKNDENEQNEIVIGKLEFESIDFGSVIEGNAKVLRITPVTESTLKLNLT